MRQVAAPIAVLVLAALTPSPAYAYIDPGLASMLLQGLIGSVAAAVAALHVYGARVKALFTRRWGQGDQQSRDV